jgi:hypothetical protein
LRSANTTATVDEIYALMTTPANAIDCIESPVVPDPDCGAGFILADLAAASFEHTGPVIAGSVDPAQPTGANGWYTGAVGVSFSVTDPESAILSASGCDPVAITAEGPQTVTCTATSEGGAESGSVTVQRDTVRPKKPKIKGIDKRGEPPPKQRIKCKSEDATSGVAKCKIKGYSRKSGKHTLKATATDNAGLKSKVKKFKYEVP